MALFQIHCYPSLEIPRSYLMALSSEKSNSSCSSCFHFFFDSTCFSSSSTILLISSSLTLFMTFQLSFVSNCFSSFEISSSDSSSSSSLSNSSSVSDYSDALAGMTFYFGCVFFSSFGFNQGMPAIFCFGGGTYFFGYYLSFSPPSCIAVSFEISFSSSSSLSSSSSSFESKP